MNAQLFSEKFTELFKEIDDTELLWDDETSYYNLYNHLDSITAKMEELPVEEKMTVFVKEGAKLVDGIEAYKLDLLKLPSLTDDQITRIILLNRVEFLLYQKIKKFKNDMNSVHFMIADKLVQGALATGLNGPYHELYLKELLDYKSLVEAVDDFSKTKPVVEKYGKKVPDDQKIKLSQMKTQELFKVAEQILEETPNQFLARFDNYKNGLLTHVKEI